MQLCSASVFCSLWAQSTLTAVTISFFHTFLKFTLKRTIIDGPCGSSIWLCTLSGTHKSPWHTTDDIKKSERIKCGITIVLISAPHSFSNESGWREHRSGVVSHIYSRAASLQYVMVGSHQVQLTQTFLSGSLKSLCLLASLIPLWNLLHPHS